MNKSIFTLLCLCVIWLNAKEITVYTYHNHAPFITGKNAGLSYDLVDFLNKNSNQQYQFKLKTVPRSRLNYYLKPWIQNECGKIKKCNQDWMLLWVNPKWGFGKDSLKKFSWIPLFKDENAIIYSKNKKINYENPNSLIGKKLAGISGHKYIGIDALVKKGKITRINGNSEKSNLEKLLKGRVDVTLIPSSTFSYYLKTNTHFNALEKAKVSHQIYMRNIMSTSKNTELTNFLQSLNYATVVKNYVK